jgi:integrase
MAYYGLRPSEVASLQLSSIDWKTRKLRVEQRKTPLDALTATGQPNTAPFAPLPGRGSADHRLSSRVLARPQFDQADEALRRY